MQGKMNRDRIRPVSHCTGSTATYNTHRHSGAVNASRQDTWVQRNEAYIEPQQA